MEKKTKNGKIYDRLKHLELRLGIDENGKFDGNGIIKKIELLSQDLRKLELNQIKRDEKFRELENRNIDKPFIIKSIAFLISVLTLLKLLMDYLKI